MKLLFENWSKFLNEEVGSPEDVKKDACYHKVKARYDVWPSAYASGALVKCRKVGAANWGKSSKKENLELAETTGKSTKKESTDMRLTKEKLQNIIKEELAALRKPRTAQEKEQELEQLKDQHADWLKKRRSEKKAREEKRYGKHGKQPELDPASVGYYAKRSREFNNEGLKEEYYEVDAISENDEYCPVCAATLEEEKKPCKPSKGKRFAKRVDGKCRSFGQAGQAKSGGDRIRPGTAKGDAYCARSAKIKKCKNPPCANTLSRKKWKCKGSKSVA